MITRTHDIVYSIRSCACAMKNDDSATTDRYLRFGNKLILGAHLSFRLVRFSHDILVAPFPDHGLDGTRLLTITYGSVRTTTPTPTTPTRPPPPTAPRKPRVKPLREPEDPPGQGGVYRLLPIRGRRVAPAVTSNHCTDHVHQPRQLSLQHRLLPLRLQITKQERRTYVVSYI